MIKSNLRASRVTKSNLGATGEDAYKPRGDRAPRPAANYQRNTRKKDTRSELGDPNTLWAVGSANFPILQHRHWDLNANAAQ